MHIIRLIKELKISETLQVADSQSCRTYCVTPYGLRSSFTEIVNFYHKILYFKDSMTDALQDNPVNGSSTGSKKYGTSLNHLLNFMYAPREKPVPYHPRSSGKKYTPFNKEQFIQAK